MRQSSLRHELLTSPSKARAIATAVQSSIPKLAKFTLGVSLIGVFDALQARYFPIGSLGKEASILYQLAFMIGSMAVARFCLHDGKWSMQRNALNILMTIPVSTAADNVSLDVQTLKPYILLLPRNGFIWRSEVFSHTFLSPIANWVNIQTLSPGLTDGYVAAIGIAATYLTLQYLWSKTQLNPKLLARPGSLTVQTKKP